MSKRTALHDLLDTADGRLEIEHVDITVPEQVEALRGGSAAAGSTRASKSALNQLMRSYAARHRDDTRTLLLMAPGWVRTDLGGPHAKLTIGESIPSLITTIDAQKGRAGLQYLDYRGETVAW